MKLKLTSDKDLQVLYGFAHRFGNATPRISTLPLSMTISGVRIRGVSVTKAVELWEHTLLLDVNGQSQTD